jgi:hypothetical protein
LGVGLTTPTPVKQLLRSPTRIAGRILKYDDQNYGRRHMTRGRLENNGVKRWRLVAKDRTEWAGIMVREAKALQGP